MISGLILSTIGCTIEGTIEFKFCLILSTTADHNHKSFKEDKATLVWK